MSFKVFSKFVTFQKYRHNSLIFILAREMNANHHVVHRLDRLTSGLMIMAKTKEHRNGVLIYEVFSFSTPLFFNLKT